MAIYKTVDAIPLSFVRVQNGSLVSGLSVTVKVINAVTGENLLNTTSMTEATPGVNVYNWNHSLTTFTECIAIYTVSGKVYAENFSVDETLDKMESLESEAV